MRAVVLRDGQLHVRETPDPEPGQGELLLRTLSTAICASDVHFMDHPALGINDPTGRSLYDADRDIVLGHEFVGEVIGHGPGCTDQFAVGSRVTAMPIRLIDGGAGGLRIIGQHPEAQGSFAELLVVSEAAAKPVSTSDVSSDAVRVVDAFAVGEFYVRSATACARRGCHRHRRGRDRPVRSRRPGKARHRADHRRRLQSRPSRAGLQRLRCARPGGSGRAVALRRVRRSSRPNDGLPGPAVVFECVGAAGLIQNIVESAEMGTRIYCAGGWYTGDTLDITDRDPPGRHHPIRRRTASTGLVRHARRDRVGSAGSAAQRRQDHHASTRSPTHSISRAIPTGRRGSSSTPTETSHDRTRRPARHLRFAGALRHWASTDATGLCSEPFSPMTANSTTARSARGTASTRSPNSWSSSHAMAGHTLHRLTNHGRHGRRRQRAGAHLHRRPDHGRRQQHPASTPSVSTTTSSCAPRAGGASPDADSPRCGWSAVGQAGIDDFREKYGPWALVAGASDGVGAAFAEGLAERGVNVVLLARRQAVLDQVAAGSFGDAPASNPHSGSRSRRARRDGDDHRRHQRLGDRLPGLLRRRRPELQTLPRQPDRGGRSDGARNCMVPMQLCHHFAPAMVERGSGGIVIFGSGAGFAGGPNMVAYGATKAFDMVFAEALWAELHGRGSMSSGSSSARPTRRRCATLEYSRGQIASLDDVPPGAVAVDDVIAEAFENLANGPTWVVGEDMRAAMQMLGSLSRNQAVELISQASAAAMGSAD